MIECQTHRCDVVVVVINYSTAVVCKFDFDFLPNPILFLLQYCFSVIFDDDDDDNDDNDACVMMMIMMRKIDGNKKRHKIRHALLQLLVQLVLVLVLVLLLLLLFEMMFLTNVSLLLLLK